MKQVILDTINDLAMDFLYYDRKEDEELSQEQLIMAVSKGEITVDEMVSMFKNILLEQFQFPPQ
jgi:hypothetical protein